MGLIKTVAEQEKMRIAGRLLGEVLSELSKHVVEGISTKELDSIAESLIIQKNATPGFKGYMGFPATLCTAVNDEVVHTIPNNRKLQKGDLISIDCGLIYQKYYADSAITISIGSPTPEVSKFIETAKEALTKGINAAIPGNYIQDISKAIGSTIVNAGYQVIKELTGHGLGKKLHEEPHVPNFREKQRGIQLQPGMTLAIEPIFAMGSGDIVTAPDNWNILTKDKSLAIQVEHTILITKNQPEILTKRP